MEKLNKSENGFSFSASYVLENERALLRPMEAEDYERLLPFALNEPEIWTYSMIPASGEEGLKNYIRAALDARAGGREYAFVVYDKLYKAFAGSTRFYDIQTGNQALQLGYTWYGKAFQRTGLNRNCKLLMLDFAFGVMKMERVEFRADNDNVRSIEAMKAIGCTVEGVLRSNGLKADGTRRDSIVLSILKPEWEGGLRTELAKKAGIHLG